MQQVFGNCHQLAQRSASNCSQFCQHFLLVLSSISAILGGLCRSESPVCCVLSSVDDGTQRLLVVTETGDRGQMAPSPTVSTSEEHPVELRCRTVITRRLQTDKGAAVSTEHVVPITEQCAHASWADYREFTQHMVYGCVPHSIMVCTSTKQHKLLLQCLPLPLLTKWSHNVR